MSDVARASGLVAGLTVASRLLGFARWLVFSATVGAGIVGTAYGTANTVPNVLYEIAAGGALAAVVVPLVAAALARSDRAEVDAIASALLTWAVLVLLPLGVLLGLAAGPVAELLVPATSTSRPATVALVTTMMRWFAPQVPLYGIGIVVSGVLQAHRRFAAAALAPVLSSIVVIGTYLAYARVKASTADPGGAAVTVLAVGTTLGVLVLSVPLLVPLRRAGVRVRPRLRLPDGLGRRAASLASAGIVALLAQQLAVVATIRVANAHDGDGALTVFQYGQAVYLLPYAVLAVPIATATFPALAAHAHVDAEAATARLAASLRAIAAVSGIGTAALLAASGALGRFFAGIDAAGGRPAAGGGTSLDVSSSLDALVLALAPGLLGYGLAALLTRALYVRGRPRVASAWTAAGWGVAGIVPLAVAAAEPSAVRRLVVVGIASSLGAGLTAAGLVGAVRGAWPPGALHGLGRSCLAAATAAVAGGSVGWGLDRLLAPHSSTPGAAVAAGLGEGLAAVAVAAAVAPLVDPSARAAVSVLVTRLRRGRPSVG